MWIGIAVFLVAGLVVAEVGRRGAAGTLPRNHFAGIRLPSTMRDDESWKRAHLAGVLYSGWRGVSAIRPGRR